MIIYLLRENREDSNAHKIGITRDKTMKRVKALQTGNSSEIIIVNTFESKWAIKIETGMHAKYHLIHKRGEWYEMEPEHVESFIKDCQELHDIFEMLSTQNTYVIDKKLLK